MAPPADLSTVLGKKADETISKTDDTHRKIEDMQTSIQLLSEEQSEVKVWRPTVENRVLDLQNSVYDMKQKVDLFIHQLPKTSSSGDGKHAHEMSAPAHLGATADAGTSGQFDHGEDPQHRSVGAGVVTTLVPPPVTGARFSQNPTPVSFSGFSPAYTPAVSFRAAFGHVVPPLDFPKFDGTNPKIWVKRCETYFDIYEVPDYYRVKLAIMNFTNSAAFWIQSIEMDVKTLSWEDLCQSVVDRFERDQYNHVVRQFFHLKQTSTVAEYVEQFDELVHQLLAHDPYFFPVAITSKFVDGLQ